MNLYEAIVTGKATRVPDIFSEVFEWEDERGKVRGNKYTYYEPREKCKCCGHEREGLMGIMIVESYMKDGQKYRERYKWSD